MMNQKGRSGAAALVVFAAAMLLGACSSSSSSSSTSTSSAAGGATLTVTNDDSTLHSFTLDDGSVTQDVDPGTTETVTITVPASGTLAWHCRIHSSMTGTITVG